MPDITIEETISFSEKVTAARPGAAAWYIDPESGSNSNAGGPTDPWKTITAGALAARTTPGDEVRIKKSGAASSLQGGITATFTRGSPTVTLSGSPTLTIHACDVNWTQMTYVTCTLDTTYKLEGTGCVKVVPSGTFTTGLLCYKDISVGGLGIDFSGYQRIAFMIMSPTFDIVASLLRIKLCSNADGTGEVDGYTIPHIIEAGGWHYIEYNKGSALSSSVKSIAIEALIDPGASCTFYVDNFEATNDFNQTCLISDAASGSLWYPIQALSGTTLLLGGSGATGASCLMDWYKTTASGVTPYYRRPFTASQQDGIPGNNVALNVVQEGGSSDSVRISYTGGWNLTNETQEDETWFDGMNFRGLGMQVTSKNYLSFSKINFSRCKYSWYVNGQYFNWANVKHAGHQFIYDQTGTWNNNCFSGDIEGVCMYPNDSAHIEFQANTRDRVLNFNAKLVSLSSMTYPMMSIYGSNNKLLGNIYCYGGEGVRFFGNDNYLRYLEYDDLDNNAAPVMFYNRAGNNLIDKIAIKNSAWTPGFYGSDGQISKNRIGLLTSDTVGEPGNASMTTGAGTSWICFDIWKEEGYFYKANAHGYICDQVTGGQTEAWAYGGSGKCMYLVPGDYSTFYPIEHEMFFPVESGKDYQLHFQVKRNSTGSNLSTLALSMSGCGITPVDEASITATASWVEYTSSTISPTYNGYVRAVLKAISGTIGNNNAFGIDSIHVVEV